MVYFVLYKILDTLFQGLYLALFVLGEVCLKGWAGGNAGGDLN